MAWALWQNPRNRAGKLHLEFSVWRQVPVEFIVTPANTGERLVRVESGGHVFLLFTDREDLDADLVSLIYRHRWQIQLFFKWIKCILGCRHWLAESPAGMTIQIYSALIASVLLGLWTGHKPTKHQWEALQLYWLGWVTLEELTEVIMPKKKSA